MVFDGWSVLLSILSSSTLAGLIVLGARTWLAERIKASIQHEYAQRLATHTAELKALYDSKLAVHQAELSSRNSKEIERLKSELQIAAAQRQVQFSNLQTRMIEVVEQTYGALIDLLAAAMEYTKEMEFEGDPPKSERRKLLNEAIQSFAKTFRPKRIYLPSQTADSIEKFEREIFKRAHQFAWKVEKNERGDVEVWSRTAEFMREHAPNLLKELERDFRALLGHDSRPLDIRLLAADLPVSETPAVEKPTA